MGGKLPHNGRRDHARKRARRLIHRKQGRPRHHARYARLFPHARRIRRVRRAGIPPRRDGFPLKAARACAPYPVEYKRGKPKEGTEDTLQLCGQAMCLEEMLCCEIPRGALYYGEPRRRTEVDFTPALRQEVRALLEEMHALYVRGSTPKVKPTKGCNACSLKGLCLPKLMRSKSVSAYLRGARRESDETAFEHAFCHIGGHLPLAGRGKRCGEPRRGSGRRYRCHTLQSIVSFSYAGASPP